MSAAWAPDSDSATWEEILRDEGMPAELRMLTESSERDGMRCVPLASRYDGGEWAERANAEAFDGPLRLADTDQARSWAKFGQAVQAAPTGRQTRFLVALADCGMIAEARRRSGMPAFETVYRWLRLFAAWRKENGV